jgi:SOS-response transcriptional repressor LexA
MAALQAEGMPGDREAPRRFSSRPATRRQLDILCFVADSTDRKGYPPTRREIGVALGIGQQGVTDHLRAIERKGLIEHTDMVSRGLRITDRGIDALADMDERAEFLTERRCARCNVSTFTPVCKCGDPAPIREVA